MRVNKTLVLFERFILNSACLAFCIALLSACTPEETNPNAPESRIIRFGNPQPVSIQGYVEDIMEPFLSKDGSVLFFNNSNSPHVNTNLHYAVKVDSVSFEYKGELKGVNTESLEGTPTMDNTGRFFFVSTRSYDQSLATIYSGKLIIDSISDIQLVSDISRNIGGWVNFDVEVTREGNVLFYVDGRFDQNGGPYEADLVIAEKTDNKWQRSSDQSILKNINTDALEYAACISSDMLEIYFTRLELPISGSSVPQIYLATRNSTAEAFHKPNKISEIIGFVEGPTISPDNKILYYHKKVDDKFVVYCVRKED